MLLMTPSSALMIFTLGTSSLLTIMSSNWLMAWIFMEINLLSFIPMITSQKSNQEVEAAIKYFLAQAMGSAMMLFASMSLWSLHLTSTMWISILLLALLLKLGAAPCHFWFPSVMTSISWTSALLLISWQKLAPLMLLCFPLNGSKTMSSLLISVAAMNALMGGILGLNQTHLRTLLGYSSITHMGWMISAMSTNSPSISLIYFSMYVLIILPTFLLLHNLSLTRSTQLLSLIMTSKSLLLCLSLLLLSLAGLPPLTGFFPKWVIISMLMPDNQLVILILILGSYMNLYFYLNLIFNMMTTTLHAHVKSEPKMSHYNLMIILSSCTLGIIPILS